MDGTDNDRDAVNRSPAKGIRLELDAVDLTPLDELDRLRRDAVKVEEYRNKATALKDQVAPAVWQRVVADYTTRATDLERQAKPLRERAVVECRKLQVIASRVLASCEQAELVKAELEFRHAVGELDDGEFTKRLNGPLSTLARCQEEKNAVEEYKARFVGALGGNWESILATAAGTGAIPVEPGRSEVTNVLPDLPMTGDGQTSALSAEPMEAPTVVVPPAALLIGPPGVPQGIHRLAALNYLGRSEDNQIRMTHQGVSRRHAMITVTPKGFYIKDLGSQNGTFVNGGRITERLLADGDSIDIGQAKLVFRTPWPQPGAAAPTGETLRR
jgi:hypothetical protein